MTVLMLLTAGAPANAEELAYETAPSRTLLVSPDTAAPLNVDATTTRIVVSQPETARVGVAGPGSLYVMGREAGDTNLLVYGRSAELLEMIDIRVGIDAPKLQADILAAVPDEPVTVTALNSGVLLRGEVSSPSAAALVQSLAERAAPGEVTSLLHVRAGQVRLEVRLVEALTDDLQELGVDLDVGDRHAALTSGNGLVGAETPHGTLRLRGGAGPVRLDAALSALERRGTARILARPDLVALSGATASFRSGGEFPYPVPQRQGEIAVEFRPYGTALSFTPQIEGNGLIRLALTTEVSSLDARNSLRMAGVTIPALAVRRVSTTLQVRDGETIYVGGLYQEEDSRQIGQTPALADLPLVGVLFTAERVRRQRTELAVIVTVHVDQPRAIGQRDDEAAEAERGLALTVAAPGEARRPGLVARTLAAVARPFQLLAEAAQVARRWGWAQAKAVARQASRPAIRAA